MYCGGDSRDHEPGRAQTTVTFVAQAVAPMPQPERKKRTKRRYASIAETLAKWKDLNSPLDVYEEGEKRTKKDPALGLKKGCTRGEGGREDCNFNCQGVRKWTWGKWVAEVREPDRGDRLLGTSSTSTEAAIAYDEAARASYGPSAQLNFPQSNTVSGASSSSPSAWLNSPQCNTVSRDSSITYESSVCAMTSCNASVSERDSKPVAPDVEAVDGIDDRLRHASAVEDPELSLTEVEQVGGLQNSAAVKYSELSLAELEQADRVRNAPAVGDPELNLAEVEKADRLRNASALDESELLNLAGLEQVDDIAFDDIWLADEALTWAVKREQDVMSLVANKKHHECPLEAADILDIGEMWKLIDVDPSNGSSVDIDPKHSQLGVLSRNDQVMNVTPSTPSFRFESPDAKWRWSSAPNATTLPP